MATMPQGQPRSAADPDKEAYDAAMRRERLLRERRNAEEAQQREVKSTAKMSDRLLSAFEGVPRAVGELGRDPAAIRASRFVSKVARPISPALSWIEAQAGYKADLAAGLPRDEAFIRNYGGLGLAVGLGAVGAAAGSELSPGLGTWAGANIGAEAGSMAGDLAADALHGFRSWQDTVRSGAYGSVDDPRFWMNRLR